MSKKYTLVVLIVVLILFVAGFFVWKKSPTATAPAPVNSPTPVSQQNTPPITQVVPTSNTSEPVRYENKEYGFSLTLDKGWENYKAIVNSSTESLNCTDLAYSCVAQIYILLPTNDPNKSFKYWIYDRATGSNKDEVVSGYEMALNFSVIDLKKWNQSFSLAECKKDPLDNIRCPQRMENAVVGKNNKYVFYFDGQLAGGSQKFNSFDSTKEFLSQRFVSVAL